MENPHSSLYSRTKVGHQFTCSSVYIWVKVKVLSSDYLYPYSVKYYPGTGATLEQFHLPAFKPYKYAGSWTHSDRNFSSTRYPLLLDRQRRHGMRCLLTLLHMTNSKNGTSTFLFLSQMHYPLSQSTAE